MKKAGLLLMLALFISGASFAQENKKSKEERKAEMHAVMKEKLELTESESTEFFKILEDMDNELKANRKAFKDLKPKKDTKIEDMSEAEVKKMLAAGFEMKEKDLAIKVKYNEKLIAAIGAHKTAKFYHLAKGLKMKMKAKGKGPHGSNGHDKHNGPDDF